MFDIGTLLNRLGSPLLDFIYPPVCIACNKILPNGNLKICKDCWNSIPKISRENPLYDETLTKLIEQGSINNLVSCFIFETGGALQHAVHALKYREYKSIGIDLGIHIGNLMRDWNIEVDVIVPVPLHRIKQRERGYNQSEFIAQGISSVINKPVAMNAVRRIRHTQTQTRLNFEERLTNMKNAFITMPRAADTLNGKRCLLVDDIITTGATTISCAKEIFTAGAASIIAASAALAE